MLGPCFVVQYLLPFHLTGLLYFYCLLELVLYVSSPGCCGLIVSFPGHITSRSEHCW